MSIFRPILWRSTFSLALLCFSTNARNTFAETTRISTMKLLHSWVHLPNVYVWFELRDNQDRVVTHVLPQDVSVFLEGKLVASHSLSPPLQAPDGIAYVMLLDVSASMRGLPFRHLKQSAAALVRQLRPQDRLALVTFGNDVSVVADFDDRTHLLPRIQQLQPNHRKTVLFLALRKAIKMLKRTGDAFPKRKAIVLISDGKDEGSNLLLSDLLAQFPKMDAPILAIGYSTQQTTRRRYFPVLDRLAKISHGFFVSASSSRQITSKVEFLLQRMMQVYTFSGLCQHPFGFMERKRLSISVSHSGQLFTESQHVLISGVARSASRPTASVATVPSAQPTQPPRSFVALLFAGGILLALFGLFAFQRRSIKPSNPPEDDALQSKQDVDETQGALFSASASSIADRRTSSPAPSNRKPIAWVYVIFLNPSPASFPTSNNRYPIFDEGITLGRAGDIQITHDDQISGHHCLILYRKNHLFVEDLKSTNGTLLNGTSLRAKERITEQDVLQIGKTKLRLSLTEPLL